MIQKLKHSLFGVMVIPALAASSNPALVPSITSQNQAIIQNSEEVTPSSDTLSKIESERLIKANKIDTYFASRNLPLAGHGMGMVLAAEKYDLDWKLIPAIAMRETTGGKKACPITYKKTGDIRYTYNVFGWGSCSIKFESYEEAFETLARNLSGNNPRTAYHYSGKTTVEILKSYNPPSVVKDYSAQVIKIMDAIDTVVIDDDSNKELENPSVAMLSR